MRVAGRGGGRGRGRILEEGHGAVGAKETCGGGMNGREERSIGIETRKSEALTRVSPTELLRLAKQAACRAEVLTVIGINAMGSGLLVYTLR